MLHNDCVVFPIVCVIGKYLKLTVRDIPVFIGSSFVENGLVLSLFEDATALVFHVGGGVVQRIDHGVFFFFSLKERILIML